MDDPLDPALRAELDRRARALGREARDAFAFLGHDDRVRQIEATLAGIGVGDA